MDKLSPKIRIAYLVILTLVFLIGGPLLVFYSSGYRFGGEEVVSKTGGINVSLRESKAQIFLNDEIIRETNLLQRNYFLQNLEQGEYKIAIKKDGFYDWQTSVSVYPEYVTSVFPLLIKTEQEITPIEKTLTIIEGDVEIERANKEYTDLLKQFSLKAKEEVIDEREYKDILVSLVDSGFDFSWIGNRNNAPYYFCGIFECDDLVHIDIETKNITDFDFYPGREDSLIVLSKDKLYVVSVDSELNYQTFDLISGKNLAYIIDKRGNLYIKDGGEINKLAI